MLGVQLEARYRRRRLVARGLQQLAHLIAEVVVVEHEARGGLAQPPADAHLVDALAQHSLHALQELLPEPPDLVVSGLNAGSNAGINVLYSGTVAAAIEGAFFRQISIALSLEYTKVKPSAQ